MCKVLRECFVCSWPSPCWDVVPVFGGVSWVFLNKPYHGHLRNVLITNRCPGNTPRIILSVVNTTFDTLLAQAVSMRVPSKIQEFTQVRRNSLGVATLWSFLPWGLRVWTWLTLNAIHIGTRKKSWAHWSKCCYRYTYRAWNEEFEVEEEAKEQRTLIQYIWNITGSPPKSSCGAWEHFWLSCGCNCFRNFGVTCTTAHIQIAACSLVGLKWYFPDCLKGCEKAETLSYWGNICPGYSS